MKKNIEDYLIKFPNFLDKDFCEKAVIDLKNNPDCWIKHFFYSHVNDRPFSPSGDNEPDVIFSLDQPNPINDIIIKKLRPVIQQYLNVLNFSWFRGWAGYTAIKFNRYTSNHRMAIHCDHIHDIFDGERKGIPTLSLLGLLNDDFEGGDLIFFQDKKINIKQGDLLIFPSNFLYPHTIEPVTKGTRYTYVSWAW